MSSVQSARSKVTRKRSFKTAARSLSTYLKEHFKTEEAGKAWMSSVLRVTKQQVDRWLDNDTMVVDNVLYLCKSSFRESAKVKRDREQALRKGTNKPMDLEMYIGKFYDDNQTLFAIEHDTRQQQVNRWVHSDLPCVFFMGQIFRARIALPNPEKATA
jgi:hypothetical protein